MPRLEDPWPDVDAEIIDLRIYRMTRLRRGPMDLAQIDALIHRVMLRVNPDWTDQQFQAWLAETEDEEQDDGMAC
jgi:hypothetical protein